MAIANQCFLVGKDLDSSFKIDPTAAPASSALIQVARSASQRGKLFLPAWRNL